jgi:threonine dehydrogenase-like Zn-dependent dehydrogenase
MLRAKWADAGLEFSDEPLGPLQPGWVRLKVEACGICGSDLHAWHAPGARRPGLTPGHEFVGTVLDGPPGLTDARYVCSPIVGCGRCAQCASGDQQRCADRFILGVLRDGALAEVIDVPETHVVAVPDGTSPLLASMAEPLAVALHGVRVAAPEPATRMLVIGGGAIGLTVGLLARGRARQLAVVTRHDHQRKLAEGFGLEVVGEPDVAAWSAANQPDVVVETVGSGNDINEAIHAVRNGGRLVMMGVFGGGPRPVDLRSVLLKEVSLVGSFAYGTGARGTDFQAAVDLLPELGGELARLQTHQFPLRSAEDAFRAAEAKSTGSVKVTVVVDEA